MQISHCELCLGHLITILVNIKEKAFTIKKQCMNRQGLHCTWVTQVKQSLYEIGRRFLYFVAEKNVNNQGFFVSKTTP